jgi:hypothetical protein
MSVLSRVRPAIVARLAGWYWPLVATVLCCLAGFNVWQRVRLNEALDRTQTRQIEAQQARTAAQLSLGQLLGKRLRWPENLRRDGPLHSPAAGTQSRYRLVAVLNALDCSIPLSAVTQLLVRIHFSSTIDREAGSLTRVVLFTDNAITARSYRIGHNLRCPVFFDPDHQFARENGLAIEPLVLITDDRDVVVMAFTPVGPGAESWEAMTGGALGLLRGQVGGD